LQDIVIVKWVLPIIFFTIACNEITRLPKFEFEVFSLSMAEFGTKMSTAKFPSDCHDNSDK